MLGISVSSSIYRLQGLWILIYTDKKEKQISLYCIKENTEGSIVAKSYITNGLLIYD
jgi:hypothetical protein